MPDREPQRSVVRAFHNHCHKADPGDLNSSQRSFRNRSDRQIGNPAGTGDRPARVFQLLLKSTRLIGLVEFRVEDYKTAVTQCENTHDQEGVPTPTQGPMSARR